MDNVTAAIGRCQQNHDDSRESSFLEVGKVVKCQ